MPIDQPVSYNTIGRLDHNRWDESDMPVDQGISYNTIGRLDHNRWDESDMPVDQPVSYYTISKIHRNTRPNAGITYNTLDKVTVRDVNTVKATGYIAFSNVNYYFPDDAKTYTYKSLAAVDYWFPSDVKAYTYFSFSKLLYRYPDDCKFYMYTTLSDLNYRYPGDCKFYMYTTLSDLNYRYPGDCKFYMYTTVDSIVHPQPKVRGTAYTTVNSILSSEPVGKSTDYTTIDKLTETYNDRPVSYQTLAAISHEKCTNVHCDAQPTPTDLTDTFTWATTCFDTTLDQYGAWRPTYGISKFKVIATSNAFQEMFVGPWHHRTVRISDIRARLWNDELYPLSAENVTIINEGGCMFGTHQLSSVIDGTLQTTVEQLTAQKDAIVVYGDDIVLSFHLTSTAPIKQIEIAPGGYNGEPKNFPGGIRIDCFTPGTGDWYTVYRKQTMQHAISGMDDYNSRRNVWTPGKYFEFPIVDNSQLYLVNHTTSPSFCPI